MQGAAPASRAPDPPSANLASPPSSTGRATRADPLEVLPFRGCESRVDHEDVIVVDVELRP